MSPPDGEERLRRVNEMYELRRISPAQYEEKCADIEDQRALMAAPPAPLLAQQQQVLATLVDDWATMTAEERKRILATIFDSITANGEGVERLEPCEDWRPYVVAAIPKPVPVSSDSGCHRSGRRDFAAREVRGRGDESGIRCACE